MTPRILLALAMAGAAILGAACQSPVEVSSPLLRARLISGRVDSIEITNTSDGGVRFLVMRASELGYSSYAGCRGDEVLPPGVTVRRLFPDDPRFFSSNSTVAAQYTREVTASIVHCRATAPRIAYFTLEVHRRQ